MGAGELKNQAQGDAGGAVSRGGSSLWVLGTPRECQYARSDGANELRGCLPEKRTSGETRSTVTPADSPEESAPRSDYQVKAYATS